MEGEGGGTTFLQSVVAFAVKHSLCEHSCALMLNKIQPIANAYFQTADQMAIAAGIQCDVDPLLQAAMKAHCGKPTTCMNPHHIYAHSHSMYTHIQHACTLTYNTHAHTHQTCTLTHPHSRTTHAYSHTQHTHTLTLSHPHTHTNRQV